MKVLGVRQPKSTHPESMPTLLEVSIKGLPTHVQEIRTDFTLVLDTETVQLVQPVRNGLAVPSKRKLERVVDPLFGFFRCLVGSEIGRDFVDELFQLQLSFPGGQSGSSLDVLLGIADKRRDRREEEQSLGKTSKQGRVVASR